MSLVRYRWLSLSLNPGETHHPQICRSSTVRNSTPPAAITTLVEKIKVVIIVKKPTIFLIILSSLREFSVYGRFDFTSEFSSQFLVSDKFYLWSNFFRLFVIECGLLVASSLSGDMVTLAAQRHAATPVLSEAEGMAYHTHSRRTLF